MFVFKNKGCPLIFASRRGIANYSIFNAKKEAGGFIVYKF
jgi:hypothetical protein